MVPVWPRMTRRFNPDVALENLPQCRDRPIPSVTTSVVTRKFLYI